MGVKPQNLIADHAANADSHALIRMALERRCTPCSLFAKGECSQTEVARVCVQNEVARYDRDHVARMAAKPPRAVPPKTKLIDALKTQEELEEFLENTSEYWLRLQGELYGLLEPGAELAFPQITWPGSEEDPKPEAPKLPQEEVDLMERVRLKIKANYMQHKTVLRDFLEYCKERGFELRTCEGTQAASDEQHILGFTGEKFDPRS